MVTSTGYFFDQYWSLFVAVLVTISDQYWFARRPVLVNFTHPERVTHHSQEERHPQTQLSPCGDKRHTGITNIEEELTISAMPLCTLPRPTQQGGVR